MSPQYFNQLREQRLFDRLRYLVDYESYVCKEGKRRLEGGNGSGHTYIQLFQEL